MAEKFVMTDECAKILSEALLNRSKLFTKHSKTMAELGQKSSERALKKEALRFTSLANDLHKTFNLTVPDTDAGEEEE